MEETVRYFGRATGRVQGVGFRYFVQQNAQELGVKGWVKNMSDGSVTMEIQGTQDLIDEMEERIRKGNFFVKVKELVLEEREPLEEDQPFEIRY